MEMKWHPIVNGDVSRVPRGEELLFTVFDEEDGETYVASCWIEEEFEGHISITPNGHRFYQPKNVMAWMDLPLPYKTKNKCSNCKHREEWLDELGERWFECELLNVPFEKIKPGECPLKSRN